MTSSLDTHSFYECIHKENLLHNLDTAWRIQTTVFYGLAEKDCPLTTKCSTNLVYPDFDTAYVYVKHFV